MNAKRPRNLLVAALAVAAVVALPSVAEAATIHQDGRTPHRLLLQDDTGQTNFVTVEGSRSVVFHDTLVPIKIDKVSTCMPLDPYTVSCSAVRRVELDLDIGPTSRRSLQRPRDRRAVARDVRRWHRS